MIKDVVIIGLVAYIFYDRYLRENKMDLLVEDVQRLKGKSEELYERLQADTQR